MVDCDFFYRAMLRLGVDFFAGVPDSLLSDFCAYIASRCPPEKHVIAANEGGAVALACGHYLATGRPGLVYMQNSGQGNAVNPLVSLADAEVYGISVLLLIGWRGKPGTPDEPQHTKQGKITTALLDTLEIPWRIVPGVNKEAESSVEWAVATMQRTGAPAALIVKKGTFESYAYGKSGNDDAELSREQAIKTIAEELASSSVLVSTTGKISRELYEYREATGGDHSKDFLTVGSMGHVSQIALGIALARPEKQVYCLDGDGAAIMHMGALAITGSRKAGNFKHIVLNNGCHDSVGGQPTAGFSISLTGIAKACGYTTVLNASNPAELRQNMDILKSSPGPGLLEVKVTKGARADLGRPKTTPKENKAAFMKFLSQ
jgi:phosphonopyruvate decarboxylase